MANRIKLTFETKTGHAYWCNVLPTEQQLEAHDNDIKQYMNFLIRSAWKAYPDPYMVFAENATFSIDMELVETVSGDLTNSTNDDED